MHTYSGKSKALLVQGKSSSILANIFYFHLGVMVTIMNSAGLERIIKKLLMGSQKKPKWTRNAEIEQVPRYHQRFVFTHSHNFVLHSLESWCTTPIVIEATPQNNQKPSDDDLKTSELNIFSYFFKLCNWFALLKCTVGGQVHMPWTLASPSEYLNWTTMLKFFILRNSGM